VLTVTILCCIGSGNLDQEMPGSSVVVVRRAPATAEEQLPASRKEKQPKARRERGKRRKSKVNEISLPDCRYSSFFFFKRDPDPTFWMGQIRIQQRSKGKTLQKYLFYLMAKMINSKT
jgi:hypothetical protein